jgi:hypothetical protein
MRERLRGYCLSSVSRSIIGSVLPPNGPTGLATLCREREEGDLWPRPVSIVMSRARVVAAAVMEREKRCQTNRSATSTLRSFARVVRGAACVQLAAELAKSSMVARANRPLPL